MAKAVARWVAGVVLAVCAVAAFAFTCTQYQGKAQHGAVIGPWRTTWQDAAEDVRAWYQANGIQTCRYNNTDGTMTYTLDAAQTNASGWRVLQTCSAGGAPGSYQGGYNTQTAECQPECVQGEKQSKLVTVGYVRATARSDGAPWKTTDGRNFFAPAPGANPRDGAIPTEICDGRCGWVADGAPSDWWVSNDTGATGMYTAYREQGFTKTGASCTATTDAVNPSKPPPSCDGAVGQINGKTVCIAKQPPTGVMGGPTPAGTGAKNAASAAAGQKAPSEATKNPDGSDQRMGPNGERFERPGDTPSMIDTSGTGTGAGAAPAASSTGTSTGPNGTTTFEFDLQTCGLPGKPACKLDESGTPDGKGYSASHEAKLGTDWDKLDSLLPSIQSKGDKDTSWSMPAWLPASACTPWNLGTLPVVEVAITVDLCPHKPIMDGVISFLWLVGTFMLVLGMVSNVMMGPTRA